MTEAEWAMFTARLEMAFRGGLEDDREAELRRHIGRVQFDDAEDVIDDLVTRGQVFMPTPGEAVQSLRRIRPRAPIGLVLAGLDDVAAMQHLNQSFERRQALIAGGPRQHTTGQLTEPASTTRGERDEDGDHPADQ